MSAECNDGCRCNHEMPMETSADINDQHVREINRNEEDIRKAQSVRVLGDIGWRGPRESEPLFELPLFEIDNSEEKIDGPAHYGGKDNPYEAIKIIEAHELGFHLGNSIKYILRAGKKTAPVAFDQLTGEPIAWEVVPELEDLEKARWYINRRINQLTGG